MAQVRLSAPSLAAVGVTLEAGPRPALGCLVCGDAWAPALLPGGRLPPLWWVCPNGCNAVLARRPARP